MPASACRILFSYTIPISLFVTMEIIKFVLVCFSCSCSLHSLLSLVLNPFSVDLFLRLDLSCAERGLECLQSSIFITFDPHMRDRVGLDSSSLSFALMLIRPQSRIEKQGSSSCCQLLILFRLSLLHLQLTSNGKLSVAGENFQRRATATLWRVGKMLLVF